MRYCSRDPAAERRRFWSLPPPALGECGHRGLAALGIAVPRAAAFMVRDDQRPHPGRPRAFIVLENAADNGTLGEHVVIVVIPFAGGAAGRGTLEDELIVLHLTI